MNHSDKWRWACLVYHENAAFVAFFATRKGADATHNGQDWSNWDVLTLRVNASRTIHRPHGPLSNTYRFLRSDWIQLW